MKKALIVSSGLFLFNPSNQPQNDGIIRMFKIISNIRDTRSDDDSDSIPNSRAPILAQQLQAWEHKPLLLRKGVHNHAIHGPSPIRVLQMLLKRKEDIQLLK